MNQSWFSGTTELIVSITINKGTKTCEPSEKQAKILTRTGPKDLKL